MYKKLKHSPSCFGFGKWNGYMTVEASFIMPLVLFLYLSIILAALLLYNRCIISQDCFLLAMRAGSFTWAEENYGEVIYGSKLQISWQPENYVKDRVSRKSNFYPGYEISETECLIGAKQIQIRICGKNGQKTEKQVEKLNPVAMIREGRGK